MSVDIDVESEHFVLIFNWDDFLHVSHEVGFFIRDSVVTLVQLSVQFLGETYFVVE